MKGYFDYNATTPMVPSARDAWLQAGDAHWQNPSSLYHSAGAAKRKLEEVREELAEQLGVERAERIVFTSGATESNNLVIRHYAEEEGKVLLSAVEHPCVREAAKRFLPGRVEELSVEESGTLQVHSIKAHLEEDRPALVSVMAANNETGVLHPWAEIQRVCQESGVPFHCDAAQWIGKMPLDGLGVCDWLTGSGHKFGGPKGVGFLVVPSGLEEIRGTQTGGPQERGLRAGTENYPAIAAMLAALQDAERLRGQVADSQAERRNVFEEQVQETIPGTEVVGIAADRLWNTSMLVMPSHGNLKWLTRLSHRGYQLSTGSACSSGKDNPSHVMEAMGLDYEAMGRVLRISGGWETSAEDWEGLAEELADVWEGLQEGKRDSRTKGKIDLANPF